MSMFTVVKSLTSWPRLRAADKAFKNTSGSTTAEPMFKYTPPLSSATWFISLRKSTWLALPAAAASKLGCMWMMSAPTAMCTVTGMPSRAVEANRE